MPEVADGLMTSSSPALPIEAFGIPWIGVNAIACFDVPGFWMSMMAPSALLEKIRSPLAASLSESGSVCGTAAILPVTVS